MQLPTGLRLDRRKLEQMLPLLLLTVALVTALVLGSILSAYLEEKIKNVSRPHAAEYRACVLWASSFVAFVVTAAWIIAIAAEWLTECHPFARRWMARLLLILVGVGFLGKSLSLPTLIAFVVISALLVSVFARALVAQYAARPRLVLFEGITVSVGLSLWLSYLSCRASQQPSLLDGLDNAGVPVPWITAVGNTIAVVAIALLIATCISIIARIQAAKDPVELRALLDPLRLLLYSSAAFLAVGVIEIYLLWDWPSHLAGQREDASKAIEQMSQAVAAMCGTLYSLMLLVLFVPLSLMHERRSRALGGSVEKKSAVSMLAELIAFASPMIAAFGIPKMFLP